MTFTAVIQLGSVVAVIWYFWRDLTQITKGTFKAALQSDYDSQDFRLALGITLGTIPIVFFGFLIKVFVPDFDRSSVRSLPAIALTSIVMGTLLGLAERFGKGKRGTDAIGFWDGIWMGLAQALALIPGVSRSGSTLTAGLFAGIERAATARFSFLLGIPAITLAGLVELKGILDLIFSGAEDTAILPLLAGTLSSAIFSYAAIAWFLRFLQTHSIWIFVWYRIAFGTVILLAVIASIITTMQ